MSLHQLWKNKVKLEYREQHDDRTDKRIEKELDRSVQAIGAAPDADDEIHRHQHHLPEDVEKEEIERRKDSKHPGLQEKQKDVVLLLSLAYVVPRAQRRDRSKQSREDDQNKGHPIDTHLIPDTDRWNPAVVLDELEAGFGPVICDEQRKRNQKADKRPDICKEPDPIRPLFAKEEQRQRSQSAGSQTIAERMCSFPNVSSFILLTYLSAVLFVCQSFGQAELSGSRDRPRKTRSAQVP